MDDEVWDHSTFSKNRDRLLDADIVRKFFLQIRQLAEAEGLLFNEHFTVDGTLIEARASQKSFQHCCAPFFLCERPQRPRYVSRVNVLHFSQFNPR